MFSYLCHTNYSFWVARIVNTQTINALAVPLVTSWTHSSLFLSSKCSVWMLITFSYFLWFSVTPGVVLWLASLFQFCLDIDHRLRASQVGKTFVSRLYISKGDCWSNTDLAPIWPFRQWAANIVGERNIWLKIMYCEQHKKTIQWPKMDWLHPHLSKFKSIRTVASCSFLLPRVLHSD